MSKPKYLLLVLGAAAMTVACWYACDIPVAKLRVLAAAGAAFCGGATLLLAYRLGGELAAREPVVVIDDDGIHDRRWAVGTIPWRDIAGVRVFEYRGNSFLCVDVVDRDAWLARLSWWRRLSARTNLRLGAGVLNITFVGLQQRLGDAMAFVTALRQPRDERTS